MQYTPGFGAAATPSGETIRARYGAMMLTQLAATLGTPDPMSEAFDPNGACGYALTCILQFADFCAARGKQLYPLHGLAEIAADFALGRTSPEEGAAANTAAPVAAAEPVRAEGALSADELISAVHALVRHMQAEGPDTVQENVRVLARWLDERDYMPDYRARRPALNAYAAELYREWAQLDAEDREAALEVRAIEDAFEVYTGPLGWEEFESKWYADHAEPADPELESAEHPPAEGGEQVDPWSDDCPF